MTERNKRNGVLEWFDSFFFASRDLSDFGRGKVFCNLGIQLEERGGGSRNTRLTPCTNSNKSPNSLTSYFALPNELGGASAARHRLYYNSSVQRKDVTGIKKNRF